MLVLISQHFIFRSLIVNFRSVDTFFPLMCVCRYRAILCQTDLLKSGYLEEESKNIEAYLADPLNTTHDSYMKADSRSQKKHRSPLRPLTIPIWMANWLPPPLSLNAEGRPVEQISLEILNAHKALTLQPPAPPRISVYSDRSKLLRTIADLRKLVTGLSRLLGGSNLR